MFGSRAPDEFPYEKVRVELCRTPPAGAQGKAALLSAQGEGFAGGREGVWAAATLLGRPRVLSEGVELDLHTLRNGTTAW